MPAAPKAGRTALISERHGCLQRRKRSSGIPANGGGPPAVMGVFRDRGQRWPSHNAAIHPRPRGLRPGWRGNGTCPSWARLTPRHRESDTKVTCGRIANRPPRQGNQEHRQGRRRA